VVSRRQFLGALAAASLYGDPLGAPPGAYLPSPGPELSEIAAMGYREIEIAGFRGARAAETRKQLDVAGLVCKSAHWTLWENDADSQATIDSAVELGLEYLVTPLPSLMGKEWFEANETPAGGRAVAEKMTLNDWRWNADWFNHVGGLCQKNDVQFVYQNHGFEFRRLGEGIALDELLRRTDPTRVKIELDCGSAAGAGRDPAEVIAKYGDRIAMLHVSEAPGLAIGKGSIDWKRVFAAAKSAGVRRYYVAVDAPLMRESYRYVHAL
jgi:sugar phosphate isomerase/epimerase